MKTRILYIVRESDLFGSNQSLLNLIDGLDIAEHEVVGLVCQYDGVFCDEIKKRGIPVFYLPFDYSVYPKKNLVGIISWIFHFMIYETYALIKLLAILIKLKPQIIHTNVSVVTVGLISSLLLNIKHVWHIREYQDIDFGMRYFPCKRYFRWLLHRSNNICITKGILQHYHLASSSRNQVIYNGIMPADRICYEEQKMNYYLFVGRIEKTKGIEDLLEVFCELYKDPTFRVPLRIAGSGNPTYVQSLKDYCDQHKISQYIEFLGVCTDCFEMMKYAKALIVPSIAEAFGRVTAEALFAGCIVIGRNTAGTKEILAEMQLGLLFNNNSEMQEHILQVETNGPQHYKVMVLKGQKTATLLYSREVSVSQIMKFYKYILDK